MTTDFPTKRFARPLPWLILASAMAIAPPGLANPPGEDAAMQKLRTDCRAEGEAAGLSQRALEVYITRCVADLLSVEIHNLRKE